MHTISVIVPVFNEEDNVVATINVIANVLTRNTADWEIIAIDDGSADGSYTILKSVSETLPGRMIVLRHPVNRGPGRAFATGFERARGDIIVTLDADMTYHPSQIPILLSAINEFDIVIGSPFLLASKENYSSRLFVSRLASLGYSILSGTRLTCYTGFFRAYKADTIKHMRIECDGYEAQAEILIKAIRSNFRVGEVPVQLTSRVGGRSKFKYYREVSRHAKLIARLSVS